MTTTVFPRSTRRWSEETSFAKVQAAIDYLDNAPAGFFTADVDGNIEYLNATLAQWLGLDLSEVADRPLKLGQIMSEDNAALIAGAGRAEAQGTTRHFDVDLVKADGKNLPVRILHRLPRASGLAHVGAMPRNDTL